MVICFNATPEAHEALQRILKTGRYADMSAAISAAVANQAILDSAVVAQGGLIVETGTVLGKPAFAAAKEPPSAQPAPSPTELKRPTPPFDTSRFVASDPPATPAVSKTLLSPRHWVWGQFNKLLPVKVTCRATLNLLLQNPAIKANEAAAIITKSAASLAGQLRHADAASGRRRDEAFGAAFPSSETNSEKSMVRFSEQFVFGTGSFATSSFPIVLGFVRYEGNAVQLTTAGIEFGQMSNPIIDGNLFQSSDKFSDEELQFLRAHILAQVPAETSALKAVLMAIDNGATNPDALDTYLRQLFTNESADLTEPFLATQRTGAVSRAVELKLIRRKRQGIRVTYELEDAAQQFLTK